MGNCISATQNDFLYLQTRCGPDDVAKVPIANVILSTFISVKAICMLPQFSVKSQQEKLIDLDVEKISTWNKSKIISYCVAMLFRQTALCHYSPNTKNQIPNTKSRGTVPQELSLSPSSFLKLLTTFDYFLTLPITCPNNRTW